MKNFSAMASNPTFPFYANDYLVDTIRWSRAMQGLHISLIAESWANGGLHDDNGAPAGLGSTDVELWLKIKHKWKLVDGLWINEKLEKSRRERIAFVEKQREKGFLSAEQRKNKSTKSQPEPSHGSTGVQPLEDEDENEDKEKLKEYDLWTQQITDGNDHLFQVMFRNEGIPPGDHIQHWILDHRDLLNRYPKMRPPTQDAFRKSCLKHIRENFKKPTNGTSKSRKQTPVDLAEAWTKRGGTTTHGR